MCLAAIPAGYLAIASLLTTAAGTAATLEAQRKQASTQATYQADLTKANNASTYSAMSALRIRQSQETEAQAREQEKARLATQKSTSTAGVAAGEAGVSGNSVAAVLQEYGMQFGQFKEASQRQATLGSQATDAQIEASALNGDSSNLQINAPISQPNYLAEGLRFAGSALGTYKDYNPSAFKKKG